MDRISIFDATCPLDRHLDAVEAGRDVPIVREGRPVARLVPWESDDAPHLTIDGLGALRERISSRGGNVPVAELRALHDEIRR